MVAFTPVLRRMMAVAPLFLFQFVGSAGDTDRSIPTVVVQADFLGMPLELSEELFGKDAPAKGGREISPATSEKVRELIGKGKIKLHACPHVATSSGEAAKVLSTTEYSYVTSYGVTNGIVIPSLSTREIGSILDVKPTVGADLNTINITLSPEVVRLVRPVRQVPVLVQQGMKELAVDVPEIVKRTTNTSLVLHSGRPVVLAIMDGIREDGKAGDDPERVEVILLTATIMQRAKEEKP